MGAPRVRSVFGGTSVFQTERPGSFPGARTMQLRCCGRMPRCQRGRASSILASCTKSVSMLPLRTARCLLSAGGTVRHRPGALASRSTPRPATPMFQGDGALHKRLPRAVRVRPSALPIGVTASTLGLDPRGARSIRASGTTGRSPSGDGCGVTNRRAEFDPLAPYARVAQLAEAAHLNGFSAGSNPAASTSIGRPVVSSGLISLYESGSTPEMLTQADGPVDLRTLIRFAAAFDSRRLDNCAQSQLVRRRCDKPE
jgi:hypothetical protein